MIFAVVLVVIFALIVAVVVGVARDTGPTPADVATSYEHAWDRLDFDSLFVLSGPELRDGLDRRGFVAAKRAAYARQPGLGSLAAEVTVVDVARAGASAVVVTEVVAHDGKAVRNRVDLARRDNRWEVVGYRLAPPTGTPSAALG